MTDNIADIARGLTEAGRECLDWVRPCSSIAPFRKGAPEIKRLGLVTVDNPTGDALYGTWFHITDTGIAVRAHLENKDG